MGVKDALSACDYLQWAYYHDIDLTFTYVQSDLDSCNALTVSYFNYALDVDQGLGYLAANQYLRKLLDSLKTLTGHLTFNQTFFFQHFRQLESAAEGPAVGADQGPVFYFYMTEQLYMRQLLSGLVGKANRAQYP